MKVRRWLVGAAAGGLLLIGGFAAGPVASFAAPLAQTVVQVTTSTPTTSTSSTPSTGSSSSSNSSSATNTATPSTGHSCPNDNGG